MGPTWTCQHKFNLRFGVIYTPVNINTFSFLLLLFLHPLHVSPLPLLTLGLQLGEGARLLVVLHGVEVLTAIL